VKNPFSNTDHLIHISFSEIQRLEAPPPLPPKVTPGHPKMKGRLSAMPTLLFIAALMAASGLVSEAADSKASFTDNFNIMWSENHFTTSEDGQTWYLALDKETGKNKLIHKIILYLL
jgi:hypothetical protein